MIEPKGCPTPGACSALKQIAELTKERDHWREALVEIATGKFPKAGDEFTDDSMRLFARSALSCNAELGVWISVDDRLPESGKPVLAACGKHVLRAAYAAMFALSEEEWGLWNDGEGADYNEANDTMYWPEGWYEWNQYEEIHWYIADHPVTHWMPLPETPNAELTARPKSSKPSPLPAALHEIPKREDGINAAGGTLSNPDAADDTPQKPR